MRIAHVASLNLLLGALATAAILTSKVRSSYRHLIEGVDQYLVRVCFRLACTGRDARLSLHFGGAHFRPGIHRVPLLVRLIRRILQCRLHGWITFMDSDVAVCDCILNTTWRSLWLLLLLVDELRFTVNLVLMTDHAARIVEYHVLRYFLLDQLLRVLLLVLYKLLMLLELSLQVVLTGFMRVKVQIWVVGMLLEVRVVLNRVVLRGLILVCIVEIRSTPWLLG